MIDFSVVDASFTLRLCLMLLHSIWQFVLLALLASLVGRLFKPQGVQWRYAVDVAALVIGLVMLPVTFALLSSHPSTGDIATNSFSTTEFNQIERAPLSQQTELIEQTPLPHQQSDLSAA